MGKPGKNAATAQQLDAFKVGDWDGPVFMVNLLKFRDQARYADASAPACTGREAYARYRDLARPFLEHVGGRTVSVLDAHHVVIGDESDDWDMLLLLEYPSREAFLQMVTDPGYLAVTKHRSAALERSALIASREGR
jgi:uncharacterized protein (DUF1330 family)